MKIKKSQTTYYITEGQKSFCVYINEEVANHMSIAEYGEACSGVLKHWGSKEELIAELELMIKALKDIPNSDLTNKLK
ncbi:hypothetical protein EPO05_06025 [Patescibacteria group bacterium]|nr:MAG: hypothetical protein EPO05_06025 [Patescibacteria group bacterium]